MIDAVATVLASIIAAVIAAGVGIFSVWRSNRVARDQALISALAHFEGGTQKRSIAIGVVDGYVDGKNRRFFKIIVPILLSQAIYIVFEKKDGKMKVHEEYNIYRIMKILMRIESCSSVMQSSEHARAFESVKSQYKKRKFPCLEKDFFNSED